MQKKVWLMHIANKTAW